MSYKVETSGQFEKEIKRLIKKFPSLKAEYASLITELKQHPFQGKPIGNDCYKIRIAIASKGRGKSGGARAITHVFVAQGTVYLLTIYDKSEQADISDGEVLNLIKTIK